MSQREQISDLALTLTLAVPPGTTSTVLFNAFSQALIGFIVDHLESTEQEISEDTIAVELQKFVAMVVAQSDYLINVLDLPTIVKNHLILETKLKETTQ